MNLSREIDKVLICGITPYFLEKGNFWIEKNINKIIEASQTNHFFQDNILYLEKHQKLVLSESLRKIDEMGYEKVFQVQEIGEFSQRGGIIDIFPINLNQAIRIEFLGNTIEKIEKLPVSIKDEKAGKERLKKKLKSQQLFSSLKGIKPGDYIVHLDHGIGRLSGYSSSPIEEKPNHCIKYYVIEYAKGDKLYVPFGLERKLSRYIGFVEPKISRLGSNLWYKTKRKAKADAEKIAKDLLEIYAQREMITRTPYLPNDEIDLHIASTFPYEETPDQIEAIEEIKRDLERDKPMDRLLCGDVGFGKTEIALRAAVKVVKSGYQAAVICPTTILANQHFQNFKERLKELPIKVEILSRLQTRKKQKEIISQLKLGKIDIIIATHRLLSNDIGFKRLGILIIDDEQKFGVQQKEKLKKIRTSLDVLSISATPIPRTLYLALSSLREISLIQTPPSGRIPVKTFIKPWSEKIIKKGIKEEISRRGQVYYLHNRVQTIEKTKEFLKRLLPNVRFGVAHGKMSERKLLGTIKKFQNKKIDVLIATTIIENGLDIPNVNTLIVADASKLGLSQAYQIRGRIGRCHLQAFAYFLYDKHLSGEAKTRLKALKEAEELGSGYKIALKDLEIRGAGNILGKEQSGNINRIGLNLYCQMLSDAIEKIKQKRQIL